MSGTTNNSESLDLTVNSNFCELEKTLLQVKSLRYQMYTKFLSEKLSYETKLRKLENDNNFSSFLSRENMTSTNKTLKAKALGERSINILSMSTQTTSDKGIQTCDFHMPDVSINSLCSSKRSDTASFNNPSLNSERTGSPLYDERLFAIVEQLEFLSLSNSPL